MQTPVRCFYFGNSYATTEGSTVTTSSRHNRAKEHAERRSLSNRVEQLTGYEIPSYYWNISQVAEYTQLPNEQLVQRLVRDGFIPVEKVQDRSEAKSGVVSPARRARDVWKAMKGREQATVIVAMVANLVFVGAISRIRVRHIPPKALRTIWGLTILSVVARTAIRLMVSQAVRRIDESK